MVVTATRAPQPIDTVLADLRVIDADAIANAGPMTLTELLQIRGGVEISANGGPGQVSGVFLRGSNAGHVVLLVDGVRINSATAGTNAFENIPLAQIERIEILRGVGSSLYGADAIGGVIQVFTKNADAPRSEASLGIGQWDARGQPRPGAQGRRDALVAAGGLAREPRLLGHQPGGQLLHDPDADGWRNLNLGLNLEHELADGHSLALRSMASRGRTQFDAGRARTTSTASACPARRWRAATASAPTGAACCAWRAAPTTSAPTAPSPASSTPTRTRRAGRTTSPRSAASGWRAWTGGARKWRATPPTR